MKKPILEKRATTLNYTFKTEFSLFMLSYSEPDGEIDIEEGSLKLGCKDFPLFVQFINKVYEDLKENFPDDFKNEFEEN